MPCPLISIPIGSDMPMKFALMEQSVPQRQFMTTRRGAAIPTAGICFTATAASTTYIGPTPVCGSARVLHNARVEDFAVVADSATVQNNAVVSGHALVKGNAQVDTARIRDRSLFQNAAVRDKASGRLRDVSTPQLGIMIVRGCSTISEAP